MELEEMGIAADPRDGVTLRTSATAEFGVGTERATTAAIASMMREADERKLDIDATTLKTVVRRLGSPRGDAIALMVIASAMAYYR